METDKSGRIITCSNYRGSNYKGFPVRACWENFKEHENFLQLATKFELHEFELERAAVFNSYLNYIPSIGNETAKENREANMAINTFALAK